MIFLQAALFGLLVGGAIFFLGSLLQYAPSPVRRRIRPQQRPKPELLQGQLLRHRKTTKSAVLNPELIEKIEKILDMSKDGHRYNELHKNLVKAGVYNERAINIYWGVKLGLLLVIPVMICILFLWAPPKRSLIIAIFSGLGLLGYIFPDLVLSRLISHRQKKISDSLPDALDLMVVCVEAGQGLNAAIKRVADDLMSSNPIISREFLMVNLEINAGLEREQALKNLGERSGVEDLISLCNILIQSDRFGTSMAQALKTQSDFMRTTRRQRLEELAAKTPVKLIFPLLLFIFPALMVVVLGPAIIRITEFFASR